MTFLVEYCDNEINCLFEVLEPRPAHEISTSYSITDLGALTGADDTDSVAYAINNSGAVVGISGIYKTRLRLALLLRG